FIMNKPRYDILREEFLQVVTELIGELGKFDKQVVGCNPKKAMFRINRDIRFSNDKSPYKTRFSAGITPMDLRRPSSGGGPTYYFQIEGNGKLLFKMLKNKQLRATYGDLKNEGKLQRPPKGFDPDHVHVEYLKHKSFFVWTEVDLDRNAPDRLVPDLARAFKDAFPLVTWLRSVKADDEAETEQTAA
ncbi:MAG: DUF2461 domain-containing protein, partial [Gammaproteobacteria bacterium]